MCARDPLLFFFSFWSGGVICFAFIPRTLSHNIRIDQALCRRKCPAEGWTDGFWCTEGRRGEPKEKKKSAGHLKTVSTFFSCLNLEPLLSAFASRVFYAEGENVTPCLRQLSPALPFTFQLLDVRSCCISTRLAVHICVPRATSYCLVLSRLGRSRPVREALTPLSLMRVLAYMAVRGRLSPRRAHACKDRCAILPSLLNLSVTHEVRAQVAVSNRQMKAAVIQM